MTVVAEPKQKGVASIHEAVNPTQHSTRPSPLTNMRHTHPIKTRTSTVIEILERNNVPKSCMPTSTSRRRRPPACGDAGRGLSARVHNRGRRPIRQCRSPQQRILPDCRWGRYWRKFHFRPPPVYCREQEAGVEIEPSERGEPQSCTSAHVWCYSHAGRLTILLAG